MEEVGRGIKAWICPSSPFRIRFGCAIGGPIPRIAVSGSSRAGVHIVTILVTMGVTGCDFHFPFLSSRWLSHCCTNG